MLKLFKYEGYKVTVSEEALLLKPFKLIWNRDRTQNKERALSELAYIYFFADPRSDFQYIIDEEDRMKAIVESEGMPDKWKPDKIVEDAIEFYLKFKPISYQLLEDTKFAINNLRNFLRNIDLNERDDKGKLVYTISTITSTIKQIPELVKSMEEAERKLAAEAVVDGRVRGGREKSIFEDE